MRGTDLGGHQRCWGRASRNQADSAGCGALLDQFLTVSSREKRPIGLCWKFSMFLREMLM